MTNNSIKFITKQNSLNSNEQVTSVLNPNSKPNLNLNNGKEMKNKKKKRRKGEEGLAAQPLGPASPSARAAQLAAQQRPRVSLPPLAAAAAGPHVSAARRPRPRVSPPLLAAAAAGPRKSALLFLFSTPRTTTARQSPDSNGRAG